MNKINMTTESGTVTGATPSVIVIPEYQKSKAAVRRFSALGTHADSKVKWYRPRSANEFKLVEELAAGGTTVKIPVDVAGEHVFKGYTLTTGAKLLLLTSAGWALVAISGVADVADKLYCAVTIVAPGVVIPANTRAYVVRPADVIDGLPAIGAASVTVEDFICGDAGAPLLFTIESAAANTTVAAAYVHYIG